MTPSHCKFLICCILFAGGFTKHPCARATPAIEQAQHHNRIAMEKLSTAANYFLSAQQQLQDIHHQHEHLRNSETSLSRLQEHKATAITTAKTYCNQAVQLEQQMMELKQTALNLRQQRYDLLSQIHNPVHPESRLGQDLIRQANALNLQVRHHVATYESLLPRLQQTSSLARKRLQQAQDAEAQLNTLGQELQSHTQSLQTQGQQALVNYRQGLHHFDDYRQHNQSWLTETLAWVSQISWNDEILCFPAGTQIWTADGIQAIEALAQEFDPDDPPTVYTCDLQTHTCTQQQVLTVHQSEHSSFVTLRTAAQEIPTTPNHPFLTQEYGYLSAAEIHAHFHRGASIHLYTKDEEHIQPVLLTASTTQSLQTPVTTYNLTVAGDANYFVSPEAILVHNCGLHKLLEALQRPSSVLGLSPACLSTVSLCVASTTGNLTLATVDVGTLGSSAVATASPHIVLTSEMAASCSAALAACSTQGPLAEHHRDLELKLGVMKNKAEKSAIQTGGRVISPQTAEILNKHRGTSYPLVKSGEG
ncbi:MAG: hypothetical protein OXT67_08555 [Zetaproteobacteria bacterium]|nr:hypothetical protein [Zetaproteobacteria bacterium]